VLSIWLVAGGGLVLGWVLIPIRYRTVRGLGALDRNLGLGGQKDFYSICELSRLLIFQNDIIFLPLWARESEILIQSFLSDIRHGSIVLASVYFKMLGNYFVQP
jgi:hypothetical protein